MVAKDVRGCHDLADDGLNKLRNGLGSVDLSEDVVAVLLNGYVIEFCLFSGVNRVLELLTGLVVGKGSERLEVSYDNRRH